MPLVGWQPSGGGIKCSNPTCVFSTRCSSLLVVLSSLTMQILGAMFRTVVRAALRLLGLTLLLRLIRPRSITRG